MANNSNLCWTSVATRLPNADDIAANNNSKTFLATVIYGENGIAQPPVVCTMEFNIKHNSWDTACDEEIVIAWMPMPSPATSYVYCHIDTPEISVLEY